MKKEIKIICVCSVLAALYVALEWIASTVGKIAFLDNYQIPISCFPLILAAILFGVKWGTLTALVGSFISQIAFGLSWITLVWMAPTILYTVAVAVLYMVFKRSDKRYILAFEFFISSIVLSVLNTVAMYINNLVYGIPYDIYNKLFAVIVSLKLVGSVAFAIIFAVITPTIINKMKKIIN